MKTWRTKLKCRKQEWNYYRNFKKPGLSRDQNSIKKLSKKAQLWHPIREIEKKSQRLCNRKNCKQFYNSLSLEGLVKNAASSSMILTYIWYLKVSRDSKLSACICTERYNAVNLIHKKIELKGGKKKVSC